MSNLYSGYQYIKGIQALKSYTEKIDATKAYFDFDKIKERLEDSISKLLFQLKDLMLSTETNTNLINHRDVLEMLQSSLKTYTTIEQLASIKTITNLLNTQPITNININALTGESDEYYYDTVKSNKIDLDIWQSIRLSMNASPLNAFFIDCRDGDNAKHFAMSNDTTFGNTDQYITVAKQNMNRVIKGKLKGAHISNNYFDIVCIIPCVEYRLQKDHFDKVKEPAEKIAIRNGLKYVRNNGVYMTMLPATRVDDSLALWLSKVLSNNTQIIKFNDTYCSSLERVIIIGQKEVTQKPKEDLYKKLKRIDYNSNDVIDISELEPGLFSIPTEQLELEFFRGSTLDSSDVLEAADTSLVNFFLEKQTQPLVVKDQSPLLPFNIGQVGLVLTSGCLDGVVEEMDGVYHVIKGMTTKISNTKTDISENNEQIKSTETISNQVKINVFTADGKFISLG